MPRGRGRGRGRGGSRGRGGRGRGGFRNNGRGLAELSRRSHRSKTTTVYTELADLAEPKPNTFAYFGRRPGLKQEDNRAFGPLRNRPMLFVKAKEVYDPNAFLFKRQVNEAAIVDSKMLEDDGEAKTSINIVVDGGKENEDVEMDSDFREVVQGVTELENLTLDVANEDVEVIVNDDDDDDDDVDSGVDGEEEADGEAEDDEDDEDDVDPTVNDDIDKNFLKIDNVIHQKVNDSEESSLLFDEEPDQQILNSLDVRYTGPNTEFNPVLTIGGIKLSTSIDDNGDIFTSGRLRKPKRETRKAFIDDFLRVVCSDDDDVYESDTNFDIMASDSPTEDEGSVKAVEEVKPEAEYGFLDEDFEFDVSSISITNIRFGISNQYHVRNSSLVGDDTTYAWIDEDELFDHLVANGVREHRIQAFLKHIAGDLMDEFVEQPNYSDVYILLSLEDDEESDQEGENLDMLMGLSSGFGQTNDYDYVPQEPRKKTVGTGRNKRLNTDGLDVDASLLEAMQEQYRARREKKHRKKEEAKADAIANNDLLVKYELAIKVREIKYELDQFYRDATRETLLFPPLDHHGNQTIIQMAGAFSFKASRCSGSPLYVKVSKTRKTYQYLPDYHLVENICRKRPFFGRADKRGEKGDRGDKGPHVREGDIVGAEASPIGVENIGRRLLERLGWKEGEGLGADKLGINEPVVARVKMGKGGLREAGAEVVEDKRESREKKGGNGRRRGGKRRR